jgi:hypothetical protein
LKNSCNLLFFPRHCLIFLKYSASPLDELFHMFNEDITRLKSWFDANLLALNVDKTNFVIFERRRDVFLSDQYVVRYGNEIVRRVDSVHLDSKISFSGQICHIRKKILPIMFALRRSRHLITHGTAIYYACVFFCNYRIWIPFGIWPPTVLLIS